MIVYLYHTLPSWPLSCSSLSRYVIHVFLQIQTQAAVGNDTLVSLGGFLNVGTEKPPAPVQERKYSLFLGG